MCHSPLPTQAELAQSELAEFQALAESRLHETEELSRQLCECRKELDSARLQSQTVPDAAVKDSAPYKTLQMQYSIVCTGTLYVGHGDVRGLLA